MCHLVSEKQLQQLTPCVRVVALNVVTATSLSWEYEEKEVARETQVMLQESKYLVTMPCPVHLCCLLPRYDHFPSIHGFFPKKKKKKGDGNFHVGGKQ